MRLLVSIFLYGYLLDALLSLASEWLPVAMLRGVVAWAVFCFGLVLYLLTAFMPRLPKRIILPAFLFLVWAGVCGGFPLAFLIPEHYEIALEGSQLALGIGLLFVQWRAQRTPPQLEAAHFSWGGFAFVTVLSIVLLPLALAAAVVNSTGVYLETASGGYVKLRPAGLLLEERVLTKGDRHVRLVSMIHIGEKSFYDHIRASIPTNETAVVLLEGVTDDKGLLKSHFSYAKIAALLGLDAQEKSDFQREGKIASAPGDSQSGKKQTVEYRRADVDISIFQPLTLEFINALGVILSNPTAATVLSVVEAPDSPFKKPDADAVVMHDIIDRRNDHLLSEIDGALQTSQTVIVPWGALHLPTIEAGLKTRGFTETSRVSRPVIHFWERKTPEPAR